MKYTGSCSITRTWIHVSRVYGRGGGEGRGGGAILEMSRLELIIAVRLINVASTDAFECLPALLPPTSPSNDDIIEPKTVHESWNISFLILRIFRKSAFAFSN